MKDARESSGNEDTFCNEEKDRLAEAVFTPKVIAIWMHLRSIGKHFGKLPKALGTHDVRKLVGFSIMLRSATLPGWK